MTDTLSLVPLDPLHTIMQGTVIEIIVAGALIMKPNYCKANGYLLSKHCAVGRYIRMLQRDRLD